MSKIKNGGLDQYDSLMGSAVKGLKHKNLTNSYKKTIAMQTKLNSNEIKA